MSRSLLIVNAGVGRRTAMSVLLRNGVVSEIGSRRALPGVPVINARGGSVVPALWDHHVHLRAAAARRRSVDVSAATDPATFVELVQAATDRNPPGAWLRIVGYDDDTLGYLDAHRLEQLIPLPAPLRVQHRSGHQWVLNGRALELLHGATGHPVPEDGVFFDDDAALGRLPQDETNDAGVAHEARLLALQGCIGATDMTATTDQASARKLVSTVRPWLQLDVFGRVRPDTSQRHGTATGTKLVIADHDLPGLDELVLSINRSRPGSRGAARRHL